MLPVEFWRHPRFEAMGAYTRVLLWYLLEGPQSNRLGIFRFSTHLASEHLHLPHKQVLSDMEVLVEQTGWRWDPAYSIVWVRSWFRWRLPETEKQLRLALREDLPAVLATGSPMVQEFLAARLCVPPVWRPVFDSTVRKRRPREKSADLIADGGATIDQRIVQLWNSLVTAPIPKAKWTAGRAKKIQARVKAGMGPDLADWKLAIQTLNADPWCRGEGRTGFVASLDYFVREDKTALGFLEKARAATTVRDAERVNGCRHTPACRTAVECTDRLLKSMETRV